MTQNQPLFKTGDKIILKESKELIGIINACFNSPTQDYLNKLRYNSEIKTVFTFIKSYKNATFNKYEVVLCNKGSLYGYRLFEDYFVKYDDDNETFLNKVTETIPFIFGGSIYETNV